MSVLPLYYVFFFNDTATTEIYTLSLHDALPICQRPLGQGGVAALHDGADRDGELLAAVAAVEEPGAVRLALKRSEEHTSELQSRQYLVCRLLLEKKKKINVMRNMTTLRKIDRVS